MNLAPQTEENEASSVELNHDEKYLDIRGPPTFLQPKQEKRKGFSSSKCLVQAQRRQEMKILRRSRKDKLPAPTKHKQRKAKENKSKKNRNSRRTCRTQKKFRFATDENGDVLRDFFSSGTEFTEEEIEKYWYSAEVLDRVLAQAQEDTKDTFNTSYHVHLEELLEGCNDPEFKHIFQSSTMVESAYVVANSIFRGLEVGLYSDKILQEHDEVVESVLQAQDLLKANRTSSREKSKKLAAASKKRSKYSKRVAYAMAYGDALVAFDINHHDRST